jgi:hypothetical protein
MIPLAPEEIARLMQQWEESHQKIVALDFTDSSESQLVLVMLLHLHELMAQGYRRMNEQWVHLSEVN